MRALFFITFSIFTLTIDSQNISYYYKKLKASEGPFKKGQKEGSWRYWSHLGYPLKEENYKNGKLNGKSVYYQFDESDMEMSSIVDMTKNSLLYELRLKRQKAFEKSKDDWKLMLKHNYYLISKVVCYTDGKIDSVNIYRNNKFKEQITYPYSDTTIYTVKTFQPYSYRDSSNFTIEETTFKNGVKTGPYKKYNTKYQDEVTVTGFYLDGKKDSVWIWPSDKNNIKEIIRYKNDQKHGLYEKYCFQSCIDSSLYLNGRKEGLCKSYKKGYGYKDRDTTFIYSSYSKGTQDGPQTSYKKGKIIEIISYKNGRRNGPFMEFFNDGSPKTKGYYSNYTKDSLWEKWGDGKTLTSRILYKNGDIISEESFNFEGKLRYSLLKKGESSIEISYYPDGKKKKQTEKNPEKDVVTKWDENGKKEVKVTQKQTYRKNRFEEPPVQEINQTVSARDYGDDSDVPYKSKYDRTDKYKYDKKKSYDKEKGYDKDKLFGKAEFEGGEKRHTEFLNMLTKNDRRESTGAFYVIAAITVGENGEITYLKTISDEKKKVKKKYLKEVERISLLMPKWMPARDNGRKIAENGGFNVWFFEK